MSSSKKTSDANNTGSNKKARLNGVEAKRKVYLPLRIFKTTKNKTIGYAEWNCYYWREKLATMGLPAGSYLKFEDLKREDELFSDADVYYYINSNDPDAVHYSTLASLFYFSNKELDEWGLRDQMAGFYFVSSKGVHNVDADKWNTGGRESLSGVTAQNLQIEMEASSKSVQEFLQEECVKSQRTDAQYKHMEKDATYTLVKQVRIVPDVALPLFERMLNMGRYVTRRPEFNGAVKAMESVSEMV
eukprot:gene13726-15789_t